MVNHKDSTLATSEKVLYSLADSDIVQPYDEACLALLRYNRLRSQSSDQFGDSHNAQRVHVKGCFSRPIHENRDAPYRYLSQKRGERADGNREGRRRQQIRSESDPSDTAGTMGLAIKDVCVPLSLTTERRERNSLPCDSVICAADLRESTFTMGSMPEYYHCRPTCSTTQVAHRLVARQLDRGLLLYDGRTLGPLSPAVNRPALSLDVGQPTLRDLIPSLTLVRPR
ncbi:hypothetical protein C8Q74DRAFT_1296629 [Fomes fomentarius]|nr:hypothetical protein C8Q74DRAFT_1296629 [Fomes fomentarius]